MDNLTIDERLDLIKQVGEEIVTEEELRKLLETETNLIAYDGFEPSGQMHIAQGILRAINVNKMTKAGFTFKMLVADWFAYLNNKMGGDMEKIRKTGEYFVEVWRAAGMDMENVEFVWTSEMISDPKYWELVMRIARTTTLNRILRTTQIMGRSDKDELSAAQIIYPCMQAADIFLLGANVTQLGLDQRKVNMLARQIAEELGYAKPSVVSHHMLMGLGQPTETEGLEAADRAIAMKMSKSMPDTSIFMTDTKEDVRRKISKAWCPEGIVTENPILEYCKYIIFEKFPEMKISRPEKFGGDVSYANYTELEQDFADKKLFPLDLKNAVVEYIDQLLQPVRDHFTNDPRAKQLLEDVQSFQITR
jgi:tyrosyl-tRNA synthetase